MIYRAPENTAWLLRKRRKKKQQKANTKPLRSLFPSPAFPQRGRPRCTAPSGAQSPPAHAPAEFPRSRCILRGPGPVFRHRGQPALPSSRPRPPERAPCALGPEQGSDCVRLPQRSVTGSIPAPHRHRGLQRNRKMAFLPPPGKAASSAVLVPNAILGSQPCWEGAGLGLTS